MIISASRRTDIPAFYSEWLLGRLQAGFAYARNTQTPNCCRYIPLDPDIVDCLVFWTKNPQPMLDKLVAIDALGYPFYFQFTLTPYDSRLEKGLPPKAVLIDTFRALSTIIGKERIIWRYDPIILTHELPISYHLEHFDCLCDALSPYTEQCIFSFVDFYSPMRIRTADIINSAPDATTMQALAQGMAGIAQRHHLTLSTCSETIALNQYGITSGACIDQAKIEQLIGYRLQTKKDPAQRPACGCIESIDLGTYNCCTHSCLYCYATTDPVAARRLMRQHDPYSPLLIGHISPYDLLTVQEVRSQKIRQDTLF